MDNNSFFTSVDGDYIFTMGKHKNKKVYDFISDNSEKSKKYLKLIYEGNKIDAPVIEDIDRKYVLNLFSNKLITNTNLNSNFNINEKTKNMNSPKRNVNSRLKMSPWTKEEENFIIKNSHLGLIKLLSLMPTRTFRAIDERYKKLLSSGKIKSVEGFYNGKDNLEKGKKANLNNTKSGRSHKRNWLGWTKEEEKLIKENISLDLNDISKLFPNRTKNSVYRKRWKMLNGISGVRKNNNTTSFYTRRTYSSGRRIKTWTPEEVRFLKNNLFVKDSLLTNELKRSDRAIHAKKQEISKKDGIKFSRTMCTEKNINYENRKVISTVPSHHRERLNEIINFNKKTLIEKTNSKKELSKGNYEGKFYLSVLWKMFEIKIR